MLYEVITYLIQGHAAQYRVNVGTIRHDCDSPAVQCLHALRETHQQAEIGTVYTVCFCQIDDETRRFRSGENSLEIAHDGVTQGIADIPDETQHMNVIV